MTVTFTTQLDGDEQAQAVLASIQTPGFLVPAFDRIGAQLAYDLAVYPPERPAQIYRRTNTLGRSWTHSDPEVGLFRISVLIGNNTPYAPYVQDPEQQADVHQGRWQTTRDVMEDRQAWIMREIANGISDHLRSVR